VPRAAGGAGLDRDQRVSVEAELTIFGVADALGGARCSAALHAQAVEDAPRRVDIDPEFAVARRWTEFLFSHAALNPRFDPGHDDRLAL